MSSDREYPQRNQAAEERDEILGAALRRLEVPAHWPGFHAELRAKLGTAVPERDTAHRERPTRPSWAPPVRSQARHPLRWTLGLAAAVALAAAAVAVPLSVGAPANAVAVARRAASAARTGAGLPPFELTEVTTTAPAGFQPEPPPPLVTEHIEYAGPSHWRDESVITEPFHEGTQTITRIRNGPLIASLAAGRVSVTRAAGRGEVPFSTSVAWQRTALRKLQAAGSAGGCAPSVSLAGNGPLIDGRPTVILQVGPSPCPSAAFPQANGPATYWLDKHTFLVLRAVLHGPGNRISGTIRVTGLRYHVTFPANTFHLPRPTPAPPACRPATSLPHLAALRSALAAPPLLPASLPDGLQVGAIVAYRITSGATTGRCKITAFTITYRDPTGRPAISLYEAPRASAAVRFPGRAVTIGPGLTGTLNSGTGMVILWWIQDGRYCALQSGGVAAGVRLTRVPGAVLIQIAASLRR
jgi:hypothetical protein